MEEGRRYFKVTMFFPVADNGGNLVDDGTWRWWRDELTQRRIAFTDLGVVAGWWEGYSDPNQWIVAVVATQDEIDELRRFVQLARQLLKQECMYFEWHEVWLELVI